MPEGPEIHRAADQIADAVEGQRLTRVEFGLAALRDRAAELVGQRVQSVRAAGKAMLIWFEGGQTLYSHNQLYGQWVIAKPGADPDTRRQLRVRLETARSSALLYSASDIRLVEHDEVGAIPYLDRLGPDLLDEGVDVNAVRERLHDPAFARRSLASLLLDQHFLAGMGNYLRSEVLFRAGIDAARSPRELDEQEIAALADALIEMPRWSYRTRGVERVGAGLRADLQVDHGPRFRFAVFGRAGKPCPRCGRPLERREAAGRRLYFCAACQH